MCIYIESLEEKNNNFYVGSSAICFLNHDFLIIGTNLEIFVSFPDVFYINTKFYDIFRFKFIFFDIANVLNIY